MVSQKIKRNKSVSFKLG